MAYKGSSKQEPNNFTAGDIYSKQCPNKDKILRRITYIYSSIPTFPTGGITAPSAWGEDQNHSRRDKILRCVYTDYISLCFPTFPTGSRPFSGLRPSLPTP